MARRRSSRGWVQWRRLLARLLVGAVLLLALLAWVGLRFVAPRLAAAPGEGRAQAAASDSTPATAVTRLTPDGTRYAVDNSAAVFDLDLRPPDRWSRQLFPSFAAAGAYAKANRLAVLPSTQMLLAKCRRSDERVMSLVTLAVQDGLPESGLRGRRQALCDLLHDLVVIHEDNARSALRPAAAAGIVHVAAALTLGAPQAKLDVPDALTAAVATTAVTFRADATRSAPAGMYAEDPRLGAVFAQDRCRAGGLADADAAVLISAVIAATPSLAQAFAACDRIDQALTNARLPEALSAAAVATMLGESHLREALRDPARFAALVATYRDTTRGKPEGVLGPPRLALAAYCTSKETDLLARLRGTDHLMRDLAQAVIGGTLDLKPRPTSGWYDYQWFSLETLLLTDRAQEAAKLVLSGRYTDHLRESFNLGLVVHRETHIKSLPVPFGGVEDIPPKKATVRPEFSVEPTATVILRLARGYAFLKRALPSLAGPTAAAEIDAVMLPLYGLYDQLCLELGMTPRFEPGELPEAAREKARTAAISFLRSVWQDADLARDCRAAVPVFQDTDGRTHYWAITGVKLMPTAYAYRQPPRVFDVDPQFEPARLYLPVALTAEFVSRDTALGTPAAFRALCDRAGGEAGLRRALRTTPGVYSRSSPVLHRLMTALCIVVGLAALFVFRRRLGLVPWRRVLGYAATAIALLVATGAVLVWLSPYCRVWFLVRYVASRSTALGMRCERRVVCHPPSPGALRALADLTRCGNPQTRYLAMYWLGLVSKGPEFTRSATFDDVVCAGLHDPVPEIRDYAIDMVVPGSPRQVAALSGLLDDPRSRDYACSRFEDIYEPRAVPTLVELSRLPEEVQVTALRALAVYPLPAALQRLLEAGHDANLRVSRTASQEARTWLESYDDAPAVRPSPPPSPGSWGDLTNDATRTARVAARALAFHEAPAAALDPLLQSAAADARLPLSLRVLATAVIRDARLRPAAVKAVAESHVELQEMLTVIQELPAEDRPAAVALMANIATRLSDEVKWRTKPLTAVMANLPAPAATLRAAPKSPDAKSLHQRIADLNPAAARSGQAGAEGSSPKVARAGADPGYVAEQVLMVTPETCLDLCREYPILGPLFDALVTLDDDSRGPTVRLLRVLLRDEHENAAANGGSGGNGAAGGRAL